MWGILKKCCVYVLVLKRRSLCLEVKNKPDLDCQCLCVYYSRPLHGWEHLNFFICLHWKQWQKICFVNHIKIPDDYSGVVTDMFPLFKKNTQISHPEKLGPLSCFEATCIVSSVLEERKRDFPIEPSLPLEIAYLYWNVSISYRFIHVFFNPLTHGLFEVRYLTACGLNCPQICGRICPQPWEIACLKRH